MADDPDVEITILGSDLQLEGVTKKQLLGLDQRNQPAEEISVEVPRRTNPDKTATSPADSRQKLIYVIKPYAASGSETVHVTTRAQAQAQGDELPVVFAVDERWE